MRVCWDLMIVGGGAAGLAAAAAAAAFGDRVMIIEKSNAIGRKISASGNGRCNLLNINEPRYYGNEDFALKVLENFPTRELIQYWESLGVYLSKEKEGRIYPCTFQSITVTDAYKTLIKTSGIELMLQTEVKEIIKNNGKFIIKTEHGDFNAFRVLIACGGAASPMLGGNSSGYRLLQGFGHSAIPLKPSLCPLLTDLKSVSGLSGIRVKCNVKLKNKKDETVHQEKGEVIFSDSGISGICVMQMSRFAAPGDQIVLDFASRVFSDQEDLEKVLYKRQKQIAEMSPGYLLNFLLVPKLSYAVMKQAGIEMKDRKTGDLTENEIRKIAWKCHHYALTITGNKGFDDAQVTAGGIDCNEFYPDTMTSKLVEGLHAAGEVMDVDGDCGGYNLMFATASGILAGKNGRKGRNL